MFSAAATMLWVYIAECKHNKITRFLQCLLHSAVLGTTKITKKHPRRRLTSRNDNAFYTHKMSS